MWTPQTVIMVLMACYVVGKNFPCLQEKQEYYNGHLKCHRCDACPPGTEPNFDQIVRVHPVKGALKCSGCRACQAGTYSVQPNRQRCSTCKSCGNLYRHTDQACTATRNAVCGRCLPGFHDVYKFKYNLDVPAVGKACQPCRRARKDAPECVNITDKDERASQLDNTDVDIFTLPSHFHITEDSAITNKEGRTSQGAALNTHVDSDAKSTQSSHFHVTAIQAAIYLMATVLPVLVIVSIVMAIVIVRKRASVCTRGKQPSANVDSELGRVSQISYSPCLAVCGEQMPHVAQPGKPNDSYISCDRESRTPLLPQVETDGPCAEDQRSSRDNSVATTLDFRVIQKKIGKQWKDLARGLDVSDPDIERLEMDYQDTGERIYQLLLLWKRKSESGALLGSVCSALQSIGRHDVIMELLPTEAGSS